MEKLYCLIRVKDGYKLTRVFKTKEQANKHAEVMLQISGSEYEVLSCIGKTEETHNGISRQTTFSGITLESRGTIETGPLIKSARAG